MGVIDIFILWIKKRIICLFKNCILCAQGMKGSLFMWKESVNRDLAGKGERMLENVNCRHQNMSAGDGGRVGLRQTELQFINLRSSNSNWSVVPHTS